MGNQYINELIEFISHICRNNSKKKSIVTLIAVGTFDQFSSNNCITFFKNKEPIGINVPGETFPYYALYTTQQNQWMPLNLVQEAVIEAVTHIFELGVIPYNEQKIQLGGIGITVKVQELQS